MTGQRQHQDQKSLALVTVKLGGNRGESDFIPFLPDTCHLQIRLSSILKKANLTLSRNNKTKQHCAVLIGKLTSDAP